ncbi:MAG: amidophosphoribosyltransferase [Elusimicrobiota bacterium]
MCGIVGVFGRRDAVHSAYLGLFSLQHRGQEAAGFVVADAGCLTGRTALGLVADGFTEELLRPLKGRAALGHVRYATAGDGDLKNAQPLLFDTVHGQVAIAHNGTLTNARTLRRGLEEEGAIFRTSTDSEVIVHLIARHPGPLEAAVLGALHRIEGAYSLLVLTPGTLIAVRDPFGFRPLCMGRLGKATAFASETTALNQMHARFERELEPGEMVVLSEGSRRILKPFAKPAAQAPCVFELIYFARPDSRVFGRSVQAARRALGRELAKEMSGIRADAVVPIPDSGVPAALGFAQESGLDLELGFVRSHYIGRTFIQPAQVLRDNAVTLKLAPIRESLRGKRIVLIDDSIVRGTTSRRICKMLRRVGVKEIHLAVSSPPIVSPCYYGIDTPSKAELIAANNSIEQTRRFLCVDSLTHLSIEGMLRAVSLGKKDDFCTACFTGRYPTRLEDFKPGESARSRDLRMAAV